jgi:hypothetical protein
MQDIGVFQGRGVERDAARQVDADGGSVLERKTHRHARLLVFEMDLIVCS